MNTQHTPTTATGPDTEPSGRLRRWLHRHRARQLHAGARSRLRADVLVPLAAFGTSGLEKFLKGDALQVGILLAGLVILYGAKQKNAAASLTVGGIALIGLAVMGIANDGMAVSNFLGGWIWN
ncbi:hypothetical protein GCM10009801_72960 [Streptomyces albiaxialis]|uniref:Integral membrane protein n=1 Tax=Streptomyces albiaxialis TaxID=329523 RepID=A0ABP5IH61_9ACTN